MSRSSYLKPDTIALHSGYVPESDHGSRAVPIYQTTSYVFESVRSYLQSNYQSDRSGAGTTNSRARRWNRRDLHGLRHECAIQHVYYTVFIR